MKRGDIILYPEFKQLILNDIKVGMRVDVRCLRDIVGVYILLSDFDDYVGEIKCIGSREDQEAYEIYKSLSSVCVIDN